MLVEKGLLNTKVYMCKKIFSLPYILGFVTYFVAGIFSIFLWQLTAVQTCECISPEPDPDGFHVENPGSKVNCVWTRGSLILVEIAIGLPLVLVVGIRFFKKWVDNDYEIMPSWSNPSLRYEGGMPNENGEDVDEDDGDKNNGSNPQDELVGAMPKFGLGKFFFNKFLQKN